MKIPDNIIILLKRLALLFCIYTTLRLFFLLFNLPYFSQNNWTNIIACFIAGFRFDISAIIITNLLFILLHLIPIYNFQSKGYQVCLRIYFFVINIPAIIINCTDNIYFKFAMKRATMDAFYMVNVGDDYKRTVTSFLMDYWYIYVYAGLMIYITFRLYNSINPFSYSEKQMPVNERYWLSSVVFVFIIIGARGGFQPNPLSIKSASQFSSIQNAPLVLNTTFSLITSNGNTELRPMNYFNASEEHALFNPVHIYKNEKGFRKLNVVIIIIEGLSKEYVGGLNGFKGYTPFLDSLMKRSLVFPNGFANGKISIEGIPSIIASLPSLMNEPFITSSYSSNQVSSIANVLNKEGYHTSFFHGGTNGTLGLEQFTKSIGFEKYYGRNEYNNDKDYDGHWGIYDEPFFQYFATNLNLTPQPFLGCIFSISSHHPYTIPDVYKETFKEGNLPIHRSIRYTDYSLKHFFETASRMAWFDSTLFVITADHTSFSEFPKYQTAVGKYRIPIIFYQPYDKLNGEIETIFEQIDIMPSILNYMNYSKPFFSFGVSVFDTTASHCNYNFINDNYQLICGDYSLQFDGASTISMFDFKNDTLLKSDIKEQQHFVKDSLEIKLKTFIQAYNREMINNTLSLSK